jgi:hypothetical protein
MRAVKAAKATGLALLAWAAVPAQTLVDTEELPAVQKSFESAARSDRLRCQMFPLRPVLDYSLRFHTGYRVEFPLRQVVGSGHSLSVFLRVTPDAGGSVYLSKSGALAEVPDTKLVGELTGDFIVGEGAYTVEALLQDDSRRACSAKWRIQARRTGAERDLAATTPPAAVLEDSPPLAKTAAPNAANIQRLTILLHAAPRFPRAAKLEPATVRMLADSLASVVRQLPARRVRLVVFSLDQQAVLLRKDDFRLADLEQVTGILDGLQLASVDYKTLQNRQNSDVLTSLVNQELHDPEPASAVIFLGPRTATQFDPSLQRDLVRAPATQWFYLQYRRMPRIPMQLLGSDDLSPAGMGRRSTPQSDGRLATPAPMRQAPDAIEELVRHLKQEVILIHDPAELAGAIRHMASQIPASTAPEAAAPPVKQPERQPAAAQPITPPANVEATPPPAQTEGEEDPVEALMQLRDTVFEHARRVPNHMCVETIQRDRYMPPAPLIKPSCATMMDALGQRKGSLRLDSTDWLRLDVGLADGGEIFSWAGAPRFDEREIDELVPQGAIGTGAFATLLLAVFDTPDPHFRFEGAIADAGRRVLEYSFAVSYDESHYRVRTRRGQWVITGYSGKLLVDARTFELVRLIVRTEELPAETALCAVENTMTYSMVSLSGFDYLLPKTTRQIFLDRDGGEGENDTAFADCREYRGESTISFGKTAAPAGTLPAGGDASAPFPAGLPVTIDLAATFPFAGTAAGDAIEGSLAKPILDAKSQTVLAPVGAKVRGRIMRLELRHSAQPEFVVVLRWETVSVEGRNLPLSLKPKRYISDLRGLNPLRQRVEIELPLPEEERFAAYHLPAQRTGLQPGFRTEWVTDKP